MKRKTNSSYAHNVKYHLSDIVQGIIDVLENCSYWIRYKGIVKGEYLRQKHKEYEKIGVYACLYKIILEIYLSKRKYQKLKNLSIDTTFIRNLYGDELIQWN